MMPQVLRTRARDDRAGPRARRARRVSSRRPIRYRSTVMHRERIARLAPVSLGVLALTGCALPHASVRSDSTSAQDGSPGESNAPDVTEDSLTEPPVDSTAPVDAPSPPDVPSPVDVPSLMDVTPPVDVPSPDVPTPDVPLRDVPSDTIRCGAMGEPCCEGATCSASLTCLGGAVCGTMMLGMCGRAWTACCPSSGGTERCERNTRCLEDIVCAPCGDRWQFCCEGSRCNGRLHCVLGGCI